MFPTDYILVEGTKQRDQISLDYIPGLAIVLDLDPGDLLRFALREQTPDFLQMLDQYIHPSGLNAYEAQVLAQYRNLGKDEEMGSVVYEVPTHRAMIIDSVHRVPGATAEQAPPTKDIGSAHGQAPRPLRRPWCLQSRAIPGQCIEVPPCHAG